MYFSAVSYKNLINRQNYSLNILSEAFITNQIVFYFSKNFYLVDDINDLTCLLKASGLFNFWMSKYMSKDQKSMKKIASSLKLIHLKGVFELLIYGLSFAFVVFIAEISFFLLRNCLNCTIQTFFKIFENRSRAT